MSKTRRHGCAPILRGLALFFVFMAACRSDELPNYAGCRLHFVKANYECVHYCGSSLEYLYDDNGRVTESVFSPGGPGGWIITHTTYTFDGDTLRAAHTDNGFETTDNQYQYSGGYLVRIESAYAQTTSDSTNTSETIIDHDGTGTINHKVSKRNGKVTSEDWYFYENDEPAHWRSSVGGLTNDLYFTYDDKINPEAALGIYIDNPIMSSAHNITSRLEVHDGSNNPGDPDRYSYKYDATGRPISSTRYLYTYDCN